MATQITIKKGGKYTLIHLNKNIRHNNAVCIDIEDTTYTFKKGNGQIVIIDTNDGIYRVI